MARSHSISSSVIRGSRVGVRSVRALACKACFVLAIVQVSLGVPFTEKTALILKRRQPPPFFEDQLYSVLSSEPIALIHLTNIRSSRTLPATPTDKSSNTKVAGELTRW